MRARNVITAILLIALSIGILVETLKMPIGNLKSPQAGFFPLILAIFLGIFAIILLILTIKDRIKERIAPWAKAGGMRPLCLTLVALVIFGFVFEDLGYLASTFVLLMFLVRYIGRFKWQVVIVFAIVCTLVSYVLFGILLKSQLPLGILDVILQN
jgi:putative tricarboxylic transport membrane protein